MIQKQLVSVAFWRTSPKNAANLGRQLHRFDQILTRHLVIHVQGKPTHSPIRLPLQLAMPTSNGNFYFFASLVFVNHRTHVQILFDNRDLQHLTRFWTDGQKWAVGLPAFST